MGEGCQVRGRQARLASGLPEPMRGHGPPSRLEEAVKRFVMQPYGAIAPGQFPGLHAS